MRGGGHDGVVSQPGRGDAALRTAPRHDRSVRSQLALQNLVPADDPPAVLVEKLLHAGRHIALEVVLRGVLVVALDAQLADLRLAHGALLPAHLRTLVATDVDILRRKQLHDLQEHVL